MTKARYFYQVNNGTIEVIYEDIHGFEWICDCGLSSHSQSTRTAKFLCKLLNKDLRDKDNK